MKINKEEIWKDAGDILGEIIDTEEVQGLIRLYMQVLTSNQRNIWNELFSGLLRFKIFDTPQPTVNQFWDNQILQMEGLIPKQFREKCDEICSSLDEETAFLFKHLWIKQFAFLGTMAQLKS